LGWIIITPASPEERRFPGDMDADMFITHGLCRDTFPMTRSVKLQNGSISRKASSSSLSRTTAIYLLFIIRAIVNSEFHRVRHSRCSLCGSSAMDFWSRVVPVMTTRLSLLTYSLSYGSMGLKEILVNSEFSKF
jgi:hypothetical protein